MRCEVRPTPWSPRDCERSADGNELRRDRCELPVAIDRRHDAGRIFGATEAAVVAAESAIDVALLDVEIVPQDDAAIAEVGSQVEEVVVAATDERGPERHHLHVSARARRRDRVFAECAFVLDHAEHELRIESGARRFVMHGGEKFFTRAAVAHFRREPARHLVHPGSQVGPVAVIDRHRLIRDRGGQHGDDGRREPLLGLRAGAGGQGCEGERNGCRHAGKSSASAEKRHAESFLRMKVPMSVTGTKVAPAPASVPPRAWYSTLPSLRPRSPIVMRCGIPINSISANITPGRSPRSSSSTSTPAASSSSCSRSANALTPSLRSYPTGAIATANGASGRGQTIPLASWFCSIAAATTRVMPIP